MYKDKQLASDSPVVASNSNKDSKSSDSRSHSSALEPRASALDRALKLRGQLEIAAPHALLCKMLPRSVAHVDRALLFQIFDYLRDGRAFLQCEATCVDFRSLLREEGDTIGQIGQKLWQARPIAYGARIFATGGTAYTEEESYDVDEQYWAGMVGYMEHNNWEVGDGGREVVLFSRVWTP